MRNDGLEVYYLYAQIVFFVEILKLIKTVVAGDKHYLGPGLSDLVSLDLAGCHPSSLKRGTHGDVAPAPTATVIILAVWGHVAEVLTKLIHQPPCFLPKPAASGDVARILVGDWFFDFLCRIDLYASVSYVFIKDLHAVNDWNRRLTTGYSQPVRRFEPKRPIGVPSFRGENSFHP